MRPDDTMRHKPTRREWMTRLGAAGAGVMLSGVGRRASGAILGASSAVKEFDYAKITNPVWRLDKIHLRDPAALVHDSKIHLWFTYYDPKKRTWHIGQSATKDFIEYEDIRIVSPEGYASPGNVIRVGDEWILCYQQYRRWPHYLCIARSKDLVNWSKPEGIFNTGPDNTWNIDKRTIDPLIVPAGGKYYMYYTGSTRWGRKSGHNLIGVAVSDDLLHWHDATPDKPAIGVDHKWEEPDGNENNWIVRHKGRWFMVYSASLRHQKIACALSDDLIHWGKKRLCDVPVFEASKRKSGAPVIIEGLAEPGTYHMLYQGEDKRGHMSFLLLQSTDLVTWR